MRGSTLLSKFISVKLAFILLLRGTVSSLSSFSHVPSFYSNHNSGFSVSQQISHLALAGLVLPWAISAAASDQKEIETGRAHKISESSSKRKPKAAGLPHQPSTANNALLANIDFLTQLTNSKQEKDSEMDPLKCFPKALCGLSAESAAITRRRKTGLITDYIRLMKAVSLNPSVMEKTLKKLKTHEAQSSDQQQDDVDGESESDEDDEGEDEEVEDRRRSSLLKRTTSSRGFSKIPKESKESIKKTSKRTKRRELIPKNSKEFTKQYLHERNHVEQLMDDGFHNEDTESTNWWAYENEKDPSLEALVGDISGNKLDSDSVESYYTFGGKRRPQPPQAPPKPEGPQQPPKMPFNIPPQSPPPMLKPPASPIRPASQGSSSGGESVVSSLFRSLFNFGGQQGSFNKDPFFAGFARSLPDGTPTVVSVDKTKEILTTAIEIGETLRSPNQCNTLFNGCKYQYVELLHVINDIRNSLNERGKHGFQNSLSTGIEEYNDDKTSSYGYKSSLSETSQAETLAQDYTAAASQVSKTTNKRRNKSKSYRYGKMSSMSKEDSLDIGSDEPTLYGSAQQNDMYHHKNGHNHQYNQHSSHHHRPNYNDYNEQYENMYNRQPKSLWETILSWFGFRR